MDITDKIDKLLGDQVATATGATTTANVAKNLAKGHVDVVGGECPKGQRYDSKRKVCVPIKNEGYVYVYNKKKDKRLRIPDDPVMIKKYEKKGFIVETSVVGGSYIGGTTVNIIGSGQTRTWGVKRGEIGRGGTRGLMPDLARKEPVTRKYQDPTVTNILGRKGLKFNIETGNYEPSIWDDNDG